MSNIMVDLETMGNGSNASIVAIGAVCYGSTEIKSEFYCNVDLASCVAVGLTLDPSTVMWWMKQSDEARASLMGESRVLARALMDFSTWIVGTDTNKNNIKVWGNGSDFDNVILANAYKVCDLALPWNFWNNRCFRTLKSLYPHVKLKRSGTYHNALDDAKTQALHAIKIIQSVRG